MLACFFFAEAAELDVISPLTTAWRLEWALVSDQVALLASVGYAGFAIGTLLSGLLGDSFGRRVPVLVGYVGVLIGSVGMWASAGPLAVGVFRGLTGLAVGIGVPASLAMIAEIGPSASRSSLVLICYAALVLGALYADLGLWFFLPDLATGDWRSLCLFSALPAAIALPIGLAELEDTPSFFSMRGDSASLERVLSKMSLKNGRPDVVWKAPQQPLLSLEQPPQTEIGFDVTALRASAVPLAACSVLDFSYNFVGFGCGYFFPLIIKELAEGAPIPPVGSLVLASLLGFPALFIAYSLVNSQLGNRQILAAAGGIEACAGCLLFSQGSYGPVLGIFLLKLTMLTFSQTVNTVKGALFPSEIRVSALSVSGTCGRVGALLAPAIIEKTRGEAGSPGEFSVFLGALVLVVSVATTLGVAFLPETKGQRLPD
ncbi:unnamed protein product [Polarella glacialis]|uniref:Major facilitator superfamily (MFS) profile domain-containing protein n=2 Tax=Polarella glacialis TaxID=89957 RepID=A0A813DLZ9_POLGL|nr:unnamed protein product [Polarella glacialis]